MAMNNLKNIIKKAKTDGDINTIIKDLEIYLVQKNCIIFLEEYEDYIRILPKNSMCYVDILEDTFNNIDERNYIVFETLFNKDLLKYIEKMWIHKGSIRLILREKYSLMEVQEIFNKYVVDMLHSINEKMDIFSGDLYNIEFYDKVSDEYIS